jgi:mono/diheme cytochrome c family protein
MRFKIMAALAAIALVFALAVAISADEGEKKEAEEAKYDYVGAKKCSLKPCHGNDGTYKSWLESKHATAWDDLTDEQKKDESLLKYYTTGTTKKGDVLYGVQCEACHGAGSGYKSKKVMEDREVALTKGLVIPTAETCQGCHHEKAPAALAAVAKDFDFEKAKAKAVHAMPEKEEAEAEAEK